MKFYSNGVKISAPVRRDLTVIRRKVERELDLPVISKSRLREYVDTRKVFIALVLYVYNTLQKKLKSPYKVTLVNLARYLNYSSHSSVSLHLVDSNKGNISLLEYINRDKKLRDCYSKLKVEISINEELPFRKFLEDKRGELEQEIAIINRYLRIHSNGERKKHTKS